MLFGFRPLRLMVEGMNPRSNISRALVDEPGYVGRTSTSNGCTRAIWRCQPAAASARRAALRTRTASSRLADANSGCEKRRWTCWPRRRFLRLRGFYDECLKGEVQFSLGFMKPCENWRFGGARSFGSPGTGGALGFADPDAEIGYGYVTSQMGMTFTGDARDIALREALYSALQIS